MSALQEAFNASVLVITTEFPVPGSNGTFDDFITGNGSVANGTTNGTNGSIADGYHESPYSVGEIVVLASLSAIATFLTIIGNLMVMVSFKMDKQLQTISNYFLLSLAIAGLLHRRHLDAPYDHVHALRLLAHRRSRV
ncbi:hypothetical protein MTO96_011225 [Rhipicephalus appendiculatus]